MSHVRSRASARTDPRVGTRPDAPPGLPATHARTPASSGRGSRTALCLWLPTFELRLELVRSPELDRTSVALLSPGDGVRRTVWQVSERAHDAGVRTGQLVSQAVSLCPSLTLLEPDPAHYDAAVEAMLETLSGLTPIVEPSAERGRVFLGMDGLGRLYGSPTRASSPARPRRSPRPPCWGSAVEGRGTTPEKTRRQSRTLGAGTTVGSGRVDGKVARGVPFSPWTVRRERGDR